MPAAVAVISSASGGGSSGTSITLSAATATPGRHWLASINCRAADAISSVPTDWTLIRNTVSGTSASQGELNTYRWSGGGTPAGDHVWSFTAAAYRAAVLLELTGALSAIPEIESGTTGSPDVFPSLTTVNPQSLVIGIIGKNSGGTGVCAVATPPLGYTEIIDSVSSRIGIEVCYKAFEQAGATEVQGFTFTPGNCVVQHLAISASATAAPPLIALEASNVTVGLDPDGIPDDTSALFLDAVVTSVSGGDLTATISISDPTKAELENLPSGWTDLGGGVYSSGAEKSDEELTTDLRAIQIKGLAEATVSVELSVTDPGDDIEGIPNYVSVEVVTVSVVQSDLSYDVLDGETFPWGDIQINVKLTHEFEVINGGVVDLTISGVSLSGNAGFEFVDDPEDYEVLIAPAESLTVRASALFGTVGAKTGALTIAADDPETPFVINFTANAENPAAGLKFSSLRVFLRI